MTYFDKVTSLEDLKKQYRTLAIKNHPDMGGSTEAMQEVNNEYDVLFPFWKKRSKVVTDETASSTRSEFYTQNGWKGTNYNSNRSLKDIAKLVRGYVKLQYPTCKFSITTKYASMCQELMVYLTEAPHEAYKAADQFTWKENEKVEEYRTNYPNDTKFIPKFINDVTRAMFEDVDSFVNSYNRSDCDGQQDYFDVDFYYFNCKVAEGEKAFKIVSKTTRIGNANYRDKGIKVSDKQSEQPTEAPETTQTQEQAITYSVIKDVDTRDNSTIYIVKIENKLSRDEYIVVSQKIKTIGGYYSKFKHGFLFKDEPTQALQSLFNNQEQNTKQDTSTETVNTAPKAEHKTDDKEVLKEKINKQIESAQNKIDSLSGNYQTNTWKRMNEQANRETKINGFKMDIEVLQYLIDTLQERELNTLETALINSTFRDDIHTYYSRHKAYNRTDRGTALKEIEYPHINKEYDKENWWNKEVPKEQKRLNKAGIKNTSELIQAAEQYGLIFESVHDHVDTKEQQIKKLERELKMHQKGDVQFTPSEVAEQLVSFAGINENSRVLEPSAGIGNIADVIRKVTNNVDVCEYGFSFSDLLKLKGYNVVGSDFLKYNSEPVYDAIIGNPPFSNNQDIEHLKHAYGMLKTGGKLVFIMSPHWSFANDKQSAAFRDWLDDQQFYTQDLDGKTFEMTGVNSKILVITKFEEQQKQSA